MFSPIRYFRYFAFAMLTCVALALSPNCGGEESARESQSEWMYVTAKSGLRLRSEPSTDGTRIALIPPAERVEVLERSEVMLSVDGIEAPWVRVRHKAFEGWVFGGYLGSESQGGDAVSERDRIFEGFWLGDNLCDGRRSHLEIRGDGTFEARLFGGCDVTACQCGPASGEYRIDDGRICFTVLARDFEIVRRDEPTACYRLENDRLVAAGETSGFYENYGSERLTNLKRSSREEILGTIRDLAGESETASDDEVSEGAGETKTPAQGDARY